MRTDFCERAEYFGEEFFRANREHDGATLICDLFNHVSKSGILTGDFEYKN